MLGNARERERERVKESSQKGCSSKNMEGKRWDRGKGQNNKRKEERRE